MKKMFMLIRTDGGKKYARRIGKELKDIDPEINWLCPTRRVFLRSLAERPWLNSENTLIHPRAAFPNVYWIDDLEELECLGFRVINKPKVLKLTSDKYKCLKKIEENGLFQPTTKLIKRNTSPGQIRDFCRRNNFSDFVLKPYSSAGNGENIHRASVRNNDEELAEILRSIPYNKIILQEFLLVDKIYRVICIKQKALPFVFVDHRSSGRWKLSVCLNRTTMKVVKSEDVNQTLLRKAEFVQRLIEGEINFIDILKTLDSGYVISEINTACNLLIHEELAREVGEEKWNIAREIAKHLYKEAFENENCNDS